MDELLQDKRKKNERKYEHWDELPDGARKYSKDVKGRTGWFARYVKIVDSNEVTLEFVQEIFNERGKLIEMHEKFPVDKGHKKF